MTTPEPIEPRTAAGKARSATNVYKTGIDAQTAILPGREDAGAFEALKAEYHDFHRPRTPAARRMCDQLALHEWFDHRLAKLQVALFEHECRTSDPLMEDCALGQAWSNASAKFARLQHSMTANDRAYFQCLNKLEQLESRYPGDPTAPDLSTAQPTEPKPETEQAASFLQSPPPLLQTPTAQSTEPKPETKQTASFLQSPPPLLQTPTSHPREPKPETDQAASFLQSQPPLLQTPTAQPREPKPETEQAASFLQPLQPLLQTPTAHPPEPKPPQPVHPTLENCPNCRNLGYISPNCHYVLKDSRERSELPFPNPQPPAPNPASAARGASQASPMLNWGKPLASEHEKRS